MREHLMTAYHFDIDSIPPPRKCGSNFLEQIYCISVIIILKVHNAHKIYTKIIDNGRTK